MQGQILEVAIVEQGNELLEAHLVGATTILLEDSTEFPDAPSDFMLDGADYTYTAIDREAHSLTIDAPGLVEDAEEARRVILLPLQEEKWAKVEVQDNDEPILARVSGGMYDKIPDGVREPEDQEAIVLEMVDGDWTVMDFYEDEIEIDLTMGAVREGVVPVYDESGVLRTIIGFQEDGTYTVVDVNGPPPPKPEQPTLGLQPGLLIVSSYGLTETGDPWPADFRRLDVHVGTTPAFETTIATRVNEFSIEGGSVSLALDPGTYYAKLVAVSTSGTKSVVSDEVSAVVTAPATGSGGTPIYHSDEPPMGLGAGDEALWYDTDNDNLQNYWDGDSWVPVPLGPGATTTDVIAGKEVPLDTRIELQWGVPDPDQPPQYPYSSWEPLWPGDGLYTGYVGLVLDAGAYVTLENHEDPLTAFDYWRPRYTDTTTGGVTDGPVLDEISGSVIGSGGTPVSKSSAVKGIAKIGTTWWVLHKPSHTTDNSHELLSYDESWNLTSQKYVLPAGGGIGQSYTCMAAQGTDLVVVNQVNFFGGGDPTIEVRNPTTWALVSSVTITNTNLKGQNGVSDILPLGSYDFGVSRYVLITNTGDFFPQFWAEPVDAAGVVDTTRTFRTSGGIIGSSYVLGVRWDATEAAFEMVGNYGGIYRSTPTPVDKEVWAGYTLYDSVADPDTHESALSPVTTYAIPVPKRSGLFLTGLVPDVDDEQAPDRIRVYAQVESPNLLTEAQKSFEDGSVWSGGTGSGGTVVNSATRAHLGSKSMQLTAPSGGGTVNPSINVGVLAAGTYTYSGWFYSEPANVGTGPSMRVGGAGVVGGAYQTPVDGTEGAWTRMVTTFQADGVGSITLYAYGSNGSLDVVFWDDFKLVSGNDIYQPAKSTMDLQVSTYAIEPGGVGPGAFVAEPVNGGAAPPVLSSFPAAPSGEIVSELGGLILRGDGSMEAPFRDRFYDARYDARYATKSHVHESLDARIEIIEKSFRPVGEVTMWYGVEAECPSGWLVMNGQVVSDMASRYPVLYEMLGSSTTVPDMRDRGAVGASGTKAKGTTGGSDTHTLTEANLAAHNHGVGTLDVNSTGSSHIHEINRKDGVGSSSGFARGNGTAAPNYDSGTAGSGHTHGITGSTANAGSGTAVNHQDKYRAMHYIIRAI